MDPKNPILRKIYALDGDRERVRKAYADWAQNYDTDTLEGMGYVAPILSAVALADRLPTNAQVLDAGCGTGLVGAQLQKLGVGAIDGIDLSAEMLKQAKDKAVYRRLSEANLTEPLAIPPNMYDGVLSVGVFTSGHVGPEAMDELARVAKPNAPIVITVHENVWETQDYVSHIKSMADRELIKVEDITPAPYHEKEGYICQLCILRAV